MCLILLDHAGDSGAPLVLGANREEAYDRPSRGPDWQSDPPVFAGLDLLAGGTWLGVSPTGLVVAVTNRQETWDGAGEPRSRGQLCFDALRHHTAAAALDWAESHLGTLSYRPCNLLIADPSTAGVIHVPRAPRRLDLLPGRYVLTDADINTPDSPRALRALQLTQRHPATTIRDRMRQMQEILADADPSMPERERICRRGDRFGTVSSAIVALPDADLSRAQYLFADGPPDTHPYQDFTEQLQTGP